MKNKAYFILENGAVFDGFLFGAEIETMGEAVFNTSMSGYHEVLTDPSYCGQIVAMTYPEIGNYGIIDEDAESDKIQVAGFVVKEYSKHYSNFRANRSLGDYLKENNICGIEGIDTRKLTRMIRDKGALRGGIFRSKEGAVDKLKAFPEMTGLDLTERVMTKSPYVFGTHSPEKPLIAVMDFGVKRNILRLLDSNGFSVKVYPGNYPFNEIVNDGVRGFFLSNGPGDPAAVKYAIPLLENIYQSKLPCFGICLGHQLLSIGFGASTFKLKFGHRGANQPVKNMKTGSVEITSQNHGFSVNLDSMKNNPDIEITHMNLNDNTVEGFRHKTLPVFSVQYHPEACPGPHDSAYLFGEFRRLVTGR